MNNLATNVNLISFNRKCAVPVEWSWVVFANRASLSFWCPHRRIRFCPCCSPGCGIGREWGYSCLRLFCPPHQSRIEIYFEVNRFFATIEGRSAKQSFALPFPNVESRNSDSWAQNPNLRGTWENSSRSECCPSASPLSGDFSRFPKAPIV